jgi:hypothetical protein
MVNYWSLARVPILHILRERFRSEYCGEPIPSPDLTYDHAISRSRRGNTERTNMVTAFLRTNLPNLGAIRRSRPVADAVSGSRQSGLSV